MTRYTVAVAEDIKSFAEAICDSIRERIEQHFGHADETDFAVWTTVDDVLRQVKTLGSMLKLLILDLGFHQDTLAGFRILNELTPEQRRIVVIYSAYLKRNSPTRPGKTLQDDLLDLYQIPPERIVDKFQDLQALWSACGNVFGERGAKALNRPPAMNRKT
jgi:hypothetical protein